MIRIPWSDFDMVTKKTTHSELDIVLECSECGGTNFNVNNAGYAYYMSYVNINKDDPADTTFNDSDTEVGDDFDCDWEFRCDECHQYCGQHLNQALKVFSRIRQAKPDDQLNAYIDQVLFNTLTDEKKELLDKLKGGFINFREKRQVEAMEGPCVICMDDGRPACIH